ncbi:hypothetical protein CHS0354_015627 [Potamilus streckersoni]|uniref:LRRCT domain-containing protein n=1 Tax=Potamilus streckersoni TaxID=2493646 RepID=A0AAE0W701_9BIVA|nr:hypothetical protein CHS0354_015627 [Potamilus streckersoni]
MKMTLILVAFVLLLILKTVFSASPVGCTINNTKAVCSYQNWSPPLSDSNFNPDPYQIEVYNITGQLISGAFSGLGGSTSSTGNADLYILLDCGLSDVQIQNDTFTSNLDWVKSLYIRVCNVRSGILANTFTHLTKLQKLEITEGILGSMNGNSFIGLTAVKTLKITADFLDQTFPSGLLTKLTAVETIEITSADLTALPLGAFNGLSKLKTVDLSTNSLTTIPSGSFDSLIALTNLNLDNNPWNCTCDLAWLSTWMLYTGVSSTVTCNTPATYKGLSLGRTITALGCLSNTATVTVASVSGSESSSSKSSNILLYAAFVVAGVAMFASLIIGIVACCMCYKMKSPMDSSYKVKPADTVSKLDNNNITASGRNDTFHDYMFRKSSPRSVSSGESRVSPILDVNYDVPKSRF